MKTTRHLTLACARCGRAAAELSLLPATAEGEGLWHAKDRLERSSFMGHVIKFGEWETLTAFFDQLARHHFAAARQHDPDFMAFYCWTCGRAYCEQCWRIGPPVFDEGFYDYTSGTCPEGHEQTIDD
jgi:hypothetical protein